MEWTNFNKMKNVEFGNGLRYQSYKEYIFAY